MTHKNKLPILPLRDIIVLPNSIIPLFIGRDISINALSKAEENNEIILATQKKPETLKPNNNDLYPIGVSAQILQKIELPDGTVKILVKILERGTFKAELSNEEYIFGEFNKINAVIDNEEELSILKTIAFEKFKNLAVNNKEISDETLETLNNESNIENFIDLMGANISMSFDDKVQILSNKSLIERIEIIIKSISNSFDNIELERKIKDRLERTLEKNNKEHFLNEKINAINAELRELNGDAGEHGQLKKDILAAKLSTEAEKKALDELDKLSKTSQNSSEATVIRNYIQTLIDVPWHKKTRISKDLQHAKDILNDEHYGLEKVKERIIEHLAIVQRNKKAKSPILCLVGPPGVGKTSLGKSIAKATNRKYIRYAVGGVRDENEIRGHRRTYIGSMPGRIIQKMTKVGVKNPLFLLDEIDKMGMDGSRGDPASALLEVLDQEQNNSFNDNYIEVDYDLSEVMFVCTSNSLNLPEPLLDRMEIINLSGYTEDEKLNIASKYLVEEQLDNAKISKDELNITDDALKTIIRHYTREAGVRSLNREIGKICRKIATKILLKETYDKTITSKNIDEFLGVEKYSFGESKNNRNPGHVHGLAWTSVGGDLLDIETAITNGKGKLTLTGKLGDVMKESAMAALTVVRANAKKYKIKENFFDKIELHIHVPEGATPKDGPSAGITMATAILSCVKEQKVIPNLAMTGEITLNGDVLPIGGLKEKLLAAGRGGITDVIIPFENKKNLEDIPKNITESLNIYPVKTFDEVVKIAFNNKRSKKTVDNK